MGKKDMEGELGWFRLLGWVASSASRGATETWLREPAWKRAIERPSRARSQGASKEQGGKDYGGGQQYLGKYLVRTIWQKRTKSMNESGKKKKVC